MSNQKTTIQKLIEWCKQNAFNIEDQSGVKYVVIDYEEMKLLFPELEENERNEIIDTYNQSFSNSLSSNGATAFMTGEDYYNQTYGGNK